MTNMPKNQILRNPKCEQTMNKEGLWHWAGHIDPLD